MFSSIKTRYKISDEMSALEELLKINYNAFISVFVLSGILFIFDYLHSFFALIIMWLMFYVVYVLIRHSILKKEILHSRTLIAVDYFNFDYLLKRKKVPQVLVKNSVYISDFLNTSKTTSEMIVLEFAMKYDINKLIVTKDKDGFDKHGVKASVVDCCVRDKTNSSDFVISIPLNVLTMNIYLFYQVYCNKVIDMSVYKEFKKLILDKGVIIANER